MAYEIKPMNENYIDTPLSKFPTEIDVFDRMTDVDISTWPLVIEYENYLADGDFTAAAKIIKDNPDVKNTIINADLINKHADAIMAVENFVLNEVDELINTVAQSAIGINDNPTEEQASLVSLSAEKVLPLFDVKYVTLSSSGWSSSAPYKQTVLVDGVTSNDSPTISLVLDNVTTKQLKKSMEKSWSFVDSISVNNGNITAICKFDKPTVDIPIAIKGA